MNLKNIIGKSSLLDLSKKIFNIVLEDDVFPEENEINLNSKILKAETINFVLADGLGNENLKNSMSDYLKNFNSFYINSTFPSSTKNWNKENESLLKNPDIANNQTIWTILKSKGITSNNLQPRDLVDSALSGYIYKDSRQIAYRDTQELSEIITDSSVLDNRFNFIYYPNIDISAHIFGVGSKEWHQEIQIFETFIKNLNNSQSRKMYTLITADHGLTNIPEENRIPLKYNENIKVFGDQRSVYINGDEDAVKNVFKNVPGKFISNEELGQLIGEPKTKLSKRLYPDYCFLVDDGYIIFPNHLKANLIGYHGGITPKEMNVPVIEIMNY